MVMPMSNRKLVIRTVKLTDDENKQLKKDAYAHLMNVSEYLRWLIERERAKSNGERERELCRSNYAAQLEGLGYNADGTPKGSE